jgi:hypothetical protein
LRFWPVVDGAFRQIGHVLGGGSEGKIVVQDNQAVARRGDAERRLTARS